MYKLTQHSSVPKGQSTNWLTEVSQPKAVRMALANVEGENIEQITEFVRCRDYFSDVLYCRANNTKMKMYGFSFDSKKTKFDTSNGLHILLEAPEDLTLQISSNIKELNALEAIWKTKFTCLEPVSKNKDKIITLVKADEAFTKTTHVFSFYTYLLRILSYENIDNIPQKVKEGKLGEVLTGQDLAIVSTKNSELLYKYLMNPFAYEIPQGEEGDCPVSGWKKEAKSGLEIHNYSGFSSLLDHIGRPGYTISLHVTQLNNLYAKYEKKKKNEV